MYYKLSNTATIDELKSELDIPLRHPDLYEPEFVIDGLNEKNLLLRTQTDPNHLTLSIWGILPESYDDEWSKFQRITNTLNLEVDDLKENEIFGSALYERRCAIIVTGFFTTFFDKGKITDYHNHLNSNKPFYIAGVYNILPDGFMTCALLVQKNNKSLHNVRNIDVKYPIILNNQEANRWIDTSLEDSDIYDLVEKPSITMLKSDPMLHDIHDEFSRNDSII